MHDDIDSKLHGASSGSPAESLKFTQAEHYSLPLVKSFYKKNGMRAQAPKGDLIYTASFNNHIVAALRLHPVNRAHLLRSMCVSAELRHQGIGSALLQHLQFSLNNLQCYSFPFTHLHDFYAQAHFKLCESNAAPEAISDKYHRYLHNGKKIILMKHQRQPC